MDQSTACALNELNKAFYSAQASAFSATRNNSWRGWRLALEAAGLLGECDDRATLDVLDVACGNLRFEAWMRDALPACACRFAAVDVCVDLLPEELSDDVRFTECDIVTALLEGERASVVPEGEKFDLVVSFGFMHHVPGTEARVALLDVLLSATRPGGHVVVSFWRFADDEGLASRAEQSTTDALSWGGLADLGLDANDFLLGFGESSSDLRYCHSFTTEDIDAVLASLSEPYELVARYRADGRTNALNEYVVLGRR